MVINYDRFRINQNMCGAYAEMDRYFLAHYFTNITRYATSAFLRAKLGRVFFGRAMNILDTTFEEAGAPYGSANRP